MELKKLQIDLALQSKWNIGYFASGLIFWLYVLVVSNVYPIEISSIHALVGTFCIFPVAVLLSKVFGADPFNKENKLGNLIGYTHMSVIAMSFPIILLLFFNYPEGLLLGMAIAYCLDFYVMSWAFGSPIFGVVAAIRVVLVSSLWLFLPAHRMLTIPSIVILSYVVIIILILTTRTKWLKKNA
jgi:hypothetical protein